MDSMRQAIIASKVILIHEPEYASLHLNEVFYIATLGGAQVLNLDTKIGNFMVGKQFDALLVELHDSNASCNNIDM